MRSRPSPILVLALLAFTSVVVGIIQAEEAVHRRSPAREPQRIERPERPVDERAERGSHGIDVDPYAPPVIAALPRTRLYYCVSANAYYPYVSECPEGWKPVARALQR